MKRILAWGVVAALLGAAFGSTPRALAQNSTVSSAGQPHVDYGHFAGGSTKSSSPLVTYHGGPVMTDVQAYSIFWGTSWPAYQGDKISGIDAFYSGFGGSAYAGSVREYSGNNGPITSSVSYWGHFLDAGAAPRNPNTNAILQEVASVMSRNHVALVSDGFYAVYGDVKGPGGFCAWHNYGTVSGVTIQVAWMPNTDGIAGCDPQDLETGHSEGLASLADSSAHELSEARTDPTISAWYDNGGLEVGDKCNFVYPALVTLGTTQWKIQAEWSNAAYTAGTGTANAKGQKGCVIN